jgi:hypothetical protein
VTGRRRRNKRKEQHRRQTQREEAAARSSSKSCRGNNDGLGGGCIDALLETTLGRLGRLTRSDRVYTFRFVDGLLSTTHEWCRQDVQPHKESLQALVPGDYPFFMAPLRAGRTLVIPSVQALPAEQQLLYYYPHYYPPPARFHQNRCSGSQPPRWAPTPAQRAPPAPPLALSFTVMLIDPLVA